MEEDLCPNCHQPMPKPQTVWLTTDDVMARYDGFDPRPFVEGKSAIKSKLAMVAEGEVRVWEKSSVETKITELGKT